MIRKIAAAAVLLMCMWTLSGCFWEDRGRGGYGEHDREGYGEHDRGGYGEHDRGGYGEHEERH